MSESHGGFQAVAQILTPRLRHGGVSGAVSRHVGKRGEEADCEDVEGAGEVRGRVRDVSTFLTFSLTDWLGWDADIFDAVLIALLNSTASATVLKTAYSYNINSKGADPLVETIKTTVSNFSLAAVPMGWAVDIVPALRYLPGWLPGTGFRKIARQYRKVVEASAYRPYRFVERKMAAGDN